MESKALTWGFGDTIPQELLDKLNQKQETWVLHDGWKVLNGVYLIVTNYEVTVEFAKNVLKNDIKAAVNKAQENGLTPEEIKEILK